MPRIAQTVTQTVEVEQTVKLSTKQTLNLRKTLQNVQRLQQKIKGLKAELSGEVSNVEDTLAELGVEELAFEGFKSKIVAGTRKKFDPELFVKKGGKLATYNAAMIEVPIAAYIKVTAPGDKDSD